MEKETISILYIDDEKANLTNFKFLFQYDYDIQTCLSPGEGFEMLKSKEFQIVISDQRMPEMTGVRFLEEVSKLYPGTVRILLTAYTEAQDIIDAINIGQVYQYITKPFQKQMMAHVIEKATENWLLRKQNLQLISDLKDSNYEYEQLNEELRQSIEELVIAKEKSEESDRLKTAFLQNMSHEIRTPMNAIIGFSNFLSSPELAPEKREHFVSIIQNSSKQLLSIVENILTISSLETNQENVNIQKININDIFIDLIEIFKIQAKSKNILLFSTPQFDNKQSEILTDKTKLTQILSNLIANALKFTNQGNIEFGYTIVSVETHGSKSLQQQMQFYVKDTGIGIDPNLQDKIFERFRQGDESIRANYGGSGLGLSISKGFIELLKGRIWVESEPDKGSTFYFTIPYKPANEKNITHKKDEITIPEIQHEHFKTILIAEDEKNNYLFIKELFSGMKINLIHVENGQEAVNVCKSNSNIDLVLMDIKMPVMDGYSAAKLIKEFRSYLPIIATSAYALEQEIKRYKGIFEDYITKPINVESLKQKVKPYIILY